MTRAIGEDMVCSLFAWLRRGLLLALLRLSVMLVRRTAALFVFVAVIAVGMNAVAIVARDAMPHARELGVQWAFKDTRANFAPARAALKQKRFAGCVVNPVPGKVMHVVCVPKELLLMEVMLTLMLWLAMVSGQLVAMCWKLGLAAVGARWVLNKLHRHAARKRQEAFKREMNQWPYYTVS